LSVLLRFDLCDVRFLDFIALDFITLDFFLWLLDAIFDFLERLCLIVRFLKPPIDCVDAS
jgi:hypothetical protein